MSREENDRAIATAESELNAVRERAESLISGFSGVVSGFVRDWAEYLVERTIRNGPDLLMELGDNKVSELKARAKAVIEAMPDKAKARLDGIGWIHRRELTAAQLLDIMASYHLEEEATKEIDDTLRDLIGEVAGLLIEYGLIDSSRDSAWQQGAGKPPRYSYGIPDYGIPHSADLKRAKQEYVAIVKNYVDAAKTLHGAISSRMESEAKDLWDRA